MILSSNGQNIYPEEIEDLLNNKMYVAESLVISQGGKLMALIYPDWEQVDKDGIQHSQIESFMQKNIEELNSEVPHYSKISGYRLYQEEFEKTPKRSIKRFLYQPAENYLASDSFSVQSFLRLNMNVTPFPRILSAVICPL